MLNTLVRSVMVGVSTFCFITLSTTAAQAQTSEPALTNLVAIGPVQPMAALLPLESRTLNIETQRVGLDQVADNFNQQMAMDRAIAANPMGTFLKSLPLLSNFVDETGKLDMATDVDMGINLPISVDVSNVMGRTGLVLSTDFTLED